MRVFKLKTLGEGLNESDATSVRRIRSASGPLSLMTPIPPRPGGVDNATIVSVWANTGAIDFIEQYEMSSARRSLQSDSKSARVTFADRFGHKVVLVGEAQM